jgi:hypothetical protein
MSKSIEDIIKENKNFLAPNAKWDSENRRSPNMLIGKIIEYSAVKNPSLRLSQIFSLFEINLKEIDHSTESKEIWEKIQSSKYYQENFNEFLEKLAK